MQRSTDLSSLALVLAIVIGCTRLKIDLAVRIRRNFLIGFGLEWAHSAPFCTLIRSFSWVFVVILHFYLGCWIVFICE